MDKSRKIIVIGYLIAVLFSVLIVPWKREIYSYKLDKGYSFIFSPPQPVSSIDYGTLIMEIVALTAIAGIFYLLSDKLKTEIFVTPFHFISEKLKKGSNDWVIKLLPYIALTIKQISQLEDIRKKINMNSDLFAFAIIGRPTITKKVQYATYHKLSKQHPEWNERKLLTGVLLSRLDVLRENGDMWLNTKEEFLNLTERVNTMDELCTVIIKHDLDGEGKDLTGWVRDRIDRILYDSFLNPVGAVKEKPQSESPEMPVCPHCGAGYDATEYRHDAPEWICSKCGKALPK